MRPAPLGEISPSPRTARRSRSSRSPSPPYSPRSDRRYSPARSDRGYRERRDQSPGSERGGYRDSGYRYQEKSRRYRSIAGRKPANMAHTAKSLFLPRGLMNQPLCEGSVTSRPSGTFSFSV